MSNDTVPYKFLDQCLMHPPWEVALGKFGKSPRKGGFTRYFVDQYPTAQIPHLAVDLKTFDQVSCGGNVTYCLCYKPEFWISSCRVRNAPNDVWDDNFTHFDLGLRENVSRYAR